MARRALFINALTAGSGEDLRLLNSALVGGTAFEPVTPGVGAIARGHGVLSGNALLVTPTSPTADNKVHVAAGSAAVRGTQAESQGTYVVGYTSSKELTISSKHATLTRVDFVVAQVRDGAYAAFSEDDDLVTVVEGDPGGPDPSIPHDCIPLARITILPGSGGSTVIDTDQIQDLRPQARATGGITPVNVREDMPNPQLYEVIWEYSTETILVWNGTAWTSHGINMSGAWQTFTPPLAGVVLGASGTSHCRYIKLGKMVTGIMGWDLNGTGQVVGPIHFGLPVAAYNYGTNQATTVAGRARIGSNYWSFTAEIDPPVHSTRIWRLGSAGTGQWTVGVPQAWGTNASIQLFFTYESSA